ncbi:MAG: response regulator [Desulfomonile tiedjei]|nr:response regulator [Desulfomonile tiedjei]
MNVKVLLVDDEELFTDTLASRLKLRGFNVQIALSGDEGIAKLKEFGADFVVLDVLMPGKNGIETLQEVKEISPLAEVIMITGHGTIDTAIDWLRLGAYDYLLKPSETDALVGKILRAYAQKCEQEERIRHAEIEKGTEDREG